MAKNRITVGFSLSESIERKEFDIWVWIAGRRVRKEGAWQNNLALVWRNTCIDKRLQVAWCEKHIGFHRKVEVGWDFWRLSSLAHHKGLFTQTCPELWTYGSY